ncbi:PPA1309 family protein [Jiangella gansuensis]|uniref:PPA1309 family protein n=1 Tax=Jiangella gansuensis TaxID=281473 RepID=UPI00047BA0FF|nr:PPA1309 family protein [Jiangella gansuensis]
MSADEQHSALQQALAEIERHVRDGGWDQPARLYALALTGELLAREPALAERIGITGEPGPDTLTPIEQDVPNRPIEDLLATITWPETVAGCALVMERIVLPPGAEDEMPEDDAAATTWAQQHPARSDVRVVVGVMRDGRRESVMRVRGHEADNELIRGAELSPELGNALAETFR